MNPDSHHVSELLESELVNLWQFSWRLTKQEDDAVNLLQLTCLRALEKADHYQARGIFRSWLMCLAHRIWINEIRTSIIKTTQPAAAQFHELTSDQAANDFATNNNNFIQPESKVLIHHVHDTIESLPKAQRLVVLLISIEGYNFCETAQILDIPMATVMSHLAQARLVIGNRILRNNFEHKSNQTVSEGLPR